MWAVLLAAVAGCEASGEGGPRDDGRRAPPAEAEPAPAAQPSAETPAAREQRIAALAAEAKALEKAVKLARPGRDRLVAAQDAAAAWARWSEVSGKPLPASAKRVSRVAAKEERAAAQKIPRAEGVPVRSFAPARECCKHCTTGCPCGDSCISCSKTCRKGPGCAC